MFKKQQRNTVQLCLAALWILLHYAKILQKPIITHLIRALPGGLLLIIIVYFYCSPILCRFDSIVLHFYINLR